MDVLINHLTFVWYRTELTNGIPYGLQYLECGYISDIWYLTGIWYLESIGL